MKFIHVLFLTAACLPVAAQNSDSDKKVEAFLKKNKGKWHNLNVPYEDGQLLFDVITKNKYTSALEIGTSTGHSTVWIAWAMSKTGGKVTTIEIDPKRHREALKNIEDAGLSKYVDARLANAHDLVKELQGPFDFVFSDADKEWYKKYFLELHPKLKPGGCFATHNITDGLAGDAYIDYINNHPEYKSVIERRSRSGVMLSYKKK